MDAEFWHRRWQDNQIGFHRADVLPLLKQHWRSLGLDTGSLVLVPLAGKTLDMLWLASQGHRVLGIELSPLAVEQFFAEHGLQPTVEDSVLGPRYQAGDIEMICGDAFAMPASLLSDCSGVYDRAALIALPPALRQRYADTVYARLRAGCRGLLITLEYPQQQKDGPPFSVDQAEVQAMLAPAWNATVLERRDILAQEPSFRAGGVSALHTTAYRLQKRC